MSPLSPSTACVLSLIAAGAAVRPAPQDAPQDASDPAPFKTFESQILDLAEPSSCALLPDGSMFVLESLPGRVRRFDAQGVETRRFGSVGTGDGQLSDPSDIELFDGRLYVADSGNHRVQVFEQDGTFVRAFGGFGHGAGFFNDPRGLAVAAGKVAVADARNDRVQVFDMEGAPLLAFGRHGRGDGELNLPVDIEFDPDGNLYVVDADNHRVQKFDAEGRFVKAWGDFGPFPGLFVAPSAVDFHGGRLYVTDTDNSRIQVFDTQGEREYEWGIHALRPREADGNLHYPAHAKIAPDGERAVVVERFENRLQVFRRLRPDDPETLERIDVGILAHFGGSLSAGGNYLALVQPARPELRLTQMVRGEPVMIANVEAHGRRPGQLLRPVDVALDVERRRLYCSDAANMRLLAYGWRPRDDERSDNPGFDRRMLRLVAELDFEALHAASADDARYPDTQWPIEPGALELDAAGRLHMADPRNRAVWKFDESLAIEHRYGGPDVLRRPVDLAFTKDGSRLLVVDELARRLVMIGTEVRIQGSMGGDAFVRPAGSCVDGDGNVFVSDAGRHKVFKFGPDLKPIGSWGREGDAPGLGALEFYKPTGITLNGDGDLVILDYGNHRGQIVSPAGEFRRAFGPRLFVRPANRDQ